MENIKMIFLVLMALAVLLEVIGDVFFKRWSIDNKHLWLVLGLIIYFIGTIFWAVSLKYEILSKAISVFTVINLIMVVLVGVFLFNENLSLINKIGIALGALSIILIEI